MILYRYFYLYYISSDTVGLNENVCVDRDCPQDVVTLSMVLPLMTVTVRPELR